MTIRTDGTAKHEAHAHVPVPQQPVPFDVLDRLPGYYDLHPDISLNFQLNRWLAWMTPQALPDVMQTASRVRGYADLTTAFLALADRLLAEGRRLDAALCYRAAEFFSHPATGAGRVRGAGSSTWSGMCTASRLRTALPSRTRGARFRPTGSAHRKRAAS